MPLTRKSIFHDFSIAIWRIEEDEDFFQKLVSPSDIQNESKRLQWYATRHLVDELTGQKCEVLNDALGKPYIKDSALNISITHTPIYAAVIASANHLVGTDLEMLNPKVERIAHKFLREDELLAIPPEEKIEKLILYWSAKEALYKLHGRKQLEFKTQLLIEPFKLKKKGHLKASVKANDVSWDKLEVNYEFFDDHVLTYASITAP